MSIRVFRWILVVTNLILILIPITALVLSYFFLIPKVLDDEIERTTAALSAAFAIWSCVLILTSICFLGITFTNSCCLHLIAALLLATCAALAGWLVTEQFLFRETPNWTIVGIALMAGSIWTVQVMTELLMACLLCCSPACAGRRRSGDDAEAAKKAEAEAHESGDNNVRTKRSAGKGGDDGTDEEKERLVLYNSNNSHSNNTTSSHASAAGGAFVPSPQAPPIEEVDEGEDEDEDDDDEEEEEEEGDSQAGIRMMDRSSGSHQNHDMDPRLRSIPEEKQHLLSSSAMRPMSRTSQSSGGPCPLATPEDTGV